jgi:hypothetical protein
MSTGLLIQKALYTNGSTQVDVTAAVSTKVKDGSLNFVVSPTSLNVTDPAPGQVKTLDLVYTVNGGSTNQLSKKDNELVQIDAPPAKLANGLQITKAEYGYAGNFTDVTDAVQAQVSSNGSINLKVGFSAVGLPDPNPNKQKSLKVEYSLNGAPSSGVFKDGESFKLSAPAIEAVSNSSPSQNAGSVIAIIFKSAAQFFGMFLYTLSIFTAIDYGNQFISPLLFGALAFFIPFFSFWALPFMTFAIRLFSSDDFVH